MFGYAVAGLAAIHVGPALDDDMMRGMLGQLNALALNAALALSAWRVCLEPAVRNLVSAAKDLQRGGDDEQGPK